MHGQWWGSYRALPHLLGQMCGDFLGPVAAEDRTVWYKSHSCRLQMTVQRESHESFVIWVLSLYISINCLSTGYKEPWYLPRRWSLQWLKNAERRRCAQIRQGQVVWSWLLDIKRAVLGQEIWLGWCQRGCFLPRKMWNQHFLILYVIWKSHGFLIKRMVFFSMSFEREQVCAVNTEYIDSTKRKNLFNKYCPKLSVPYEGKFTYLP